jgi:uncharacterized protein
VQASCPFSVHRSGWTCDPWAVQTRGRPADDDVPSCTACGTCCFSTLPEYVRVFGCDWDRMDDRARGYTSFDGNKCHMRIEDGRCTALVIDPLARTFHCAIYEHRPDSCRALDRGSGACRADRHEKAERPLLAIADLLKARRPG